MIHVIYGNDDDGSWLLYTFFGSLLASLPFFISLKCYRSNFVVVVNNKVAAVADLPSPPIRRCYNLKM